MSAHNLISKTVLAFILLLFISSCQTGLEKGKPGPAPAVAPTPKKEPKIALVLGGGAAKGFAHVGVIRVLEQEKIPVNMIVGTSVGSLIGGMYAANPDSFQLEWLGFKIDRNDILDFSVVYSKFGPVQGARLESFLEQNVKVKKVEETKIPFFPVATDLNTGETVTLDKGSLAKAIHASSAIPGVFVPVQFDNRTARRRRGDGQRGVRHRQGQGRRHHHRGESLEGREKLPDRLPRGRHGPVHQHHDASIDQGQDLAR